MMTGCDSKITTREARSTYPGRRISSFERLHLIVAYLALSERYVLIMVLECSTVFLRIDQISTHGVSLLHIYCRCKIGPFWTALLFGYIQCDQIWRNKCKLLFTLLWPRCWYKKLPNLDKCFPIQGATADFPNIVPFSKSTKLLPNIWGYFCKKISYQDHSNGAQSDRTFCICLNLSVSRGPSWPSKWFMVIFGMSDQKVCQWVAIPFHIRINPPTTVLCRGYYAFRDD